MWAYDFVRDRTRDGRKFRTLNVVDGSTRGALAVRVACRLKATDVIDVLADLFIARGVPAHIRSDNGPEFAAIAVKGWITGVGARIAHIEPRSPWENGCVESFDGKFRDELLSCEIFDTLAKAKVLIEQWRVYYNTARPHFSLGYGPAAPEMVVRTLPPPVSGLGLTGSAQHRSPMFTDICLRPLNGGRPLTEYSIPSVIYVDHECRQAARCYQSPGGR